MIANNKPIVSQKRPSRLFVGRYPSPPQVTDGEFGIGLMNYTWIGTVAPLPSEKREYSLM
jgi:hypothetical protein